MWTDFKFNRLEGIMMIIYYLIFLTALILDQFGSLPFDYSKVFSNSLPIIIF